MLSDGKWRDTVCKKDVRHCMVCKLSAVKNRVFTLRGLCGDTQIDRGYFLLNGVEAGDERFEQSMMRPGNDS